MYAVQGTLSVIVKCVWKGLKKFHVCVLSRQQAICYLLCLERKEKEEKGENKIDMNENTYRDKHNEQNRLIDW